MYGIQLDRSDRRALSWQLAEQLREAILSGALAAGSCLLSVRRLAEELSLSRRLVAEVYDQLASEGYLAARQGSGTRVVDGLARPERASHLAPGASPASPAPAGCKAEPPRPQPVRFDFTPGIPDLDGFPKRAWLRMQDEALSFARMRDLSYGSLQGDGELRRSLAAYLHRSRGMVVDPDQLFLTSGSTQSLLLLALLRLPGSYYHEDPAPGFAYGAFSVTGWPVVPIAVDLDGADPDALAERYPAGVPAGSMVYLTPSHQFPTGALLPARRRLRFIELAARDDAFLIEDDYDAEFRLSGHPVPPLYSLDAARVIYLGSFSKTLAPFIRTGYVIVPPALSGRFADTCRWLNIRTAAPTQRALSRLIDSGKFESHIFRQRKAYRARQEIILDFITKRWGDSVGIRGQDMGSHLYLRFHGRTFSDGFVQACGEQGIRVVRGADFYREPGRGSGEIALGFGNIHAGELPAGLAGLARLIDSAKTD